MKRWLSLVVVLAASGVQAQPPASAEDDIGRFMAERGLAQRFDELPRAAPALLWPGATPAPRASELVVTAMGFLGVPYRLGGHSVETGFDCSGFVKAMYEQAAGLVLPRRAEEQAAATQEIDRAQLQPGDLVFFNTLRRSFSHVGIYVGDGRFIHSPRPGARVRVEDMRVSYWATRFDGARRVLAQPVLAQPVPAALPIPASAPLVQVRALEAP